LAGETLVADVRAAYFYGAPLKNAKVRWSIRRRDRFTRFGGELDPFTFFDSVGLADQGIWNWQTSSRSDLVSSGEGTTGADGLLRMQARLDQLASRGSQDYVVSAEVSDETGQARESELVVPV